MSSRKIWTKFKQSRILKVFRWILFFPIIIAVFFLIMAISELLSIDTKVLFIPLGALATAGSIVVGKLIAPSRRAAISMTAVVTLILSLAFLDERDAILTIIGWPAGLVLGVILSTPKGLERSRVIRSLRWTLFVPLAAAAGIGILYLVDYLYSFNADDQVLVLALGVASALFVLVGGLVAPSNRLIAILLSTPVSFGFVFIFTTKNQSVSTDVSFLIAWALGTMVGIICTLKTAAQLIRSVGRKKEADAKTRRYKGTAPYQDLDIDRKTFFGRTNDSRSLLSLVLAERLVVLFSKSGMGKSSLINAGLVEPLRKLRYFPIVIRLNDQSIRPMDALLAGVRNSAEMSGVDIIAADTDNAWQFFKTAEFWSEENDLLRPVIILDQFEELFTLHNPSERQTFIVQLSELVRGRSTLRDPDKDAAAGVKASDDTPPPHFKFVVSLREDFLANLEELAKDIPAILHNRFRLGPLSSSAARDAIIEPARLVDDVFQTDKFSYKDEAVDRIIAFLASRREGQQTTASDEIEPVQLQLICHYLEEMVRQRQLASRQDVEIQISETDLGREEQMKQVMEGFYDRTLAALTPQFKARRVRVLCEKRLVSGSGMRIPVHQDDIKNRFGLSENILRQLVDARLLRADTRQSGTFYEVSHDRLVEPILKSRKKRLARQKWTAAAAIPLVIAVFLGSDTLVDKHRERKATEKRHKLGMLNPNSQDALQSLASLMDTAVDFKPKHLLEDIKETAVLNPAALSIFFLYHRDGRTIDGLDVKNPKVRDAVENLKLKAADRQNVLEHIEEYYKTFFKEDYAQGAPTLLGILLFIIEGIENSPENHDQSITELVGKVKKEVKQEYSDNYCSSGFCSDTRSQPSKPLAKTNLKPVSNLEYSRFFNQHKFTAKTEDNAVKVNWFEALAYARCAGKKLPSKDDLEALNIDAKNFALNYEETVKEHEERTFFFRGPGPLLKRLSDKNRTFQIYLR